jgi:hypothetical protein
MTPAPLLLFVWGIAMALQLLPHRIWGIPLPKTPAWYRAGRVLGVAAILSSGPWLVLDVTLPRLMQPRLAARLADGIGWGCVLLAALCAVVVIRSAPSSSDASRPNRHRATIAD